MKVRYTVTAAMKGKDVFEEYVQWLQGGHVQALITAGALSACVEAHQDNTEEEFKVDSVYVFACQADLDSYSAGAAVALREEGIKLFVETGKVTFSRKVTNIVFELP